MSHEKWFSPHDFYIGKIAIDNLITIFRSGHFFCSVVVFVLCLSFDSNESEFKWNQKIYQRTNRNETLIKINMHWRWTRRQKRHRESNSNSNVIWNRKKSRPPDRTKCETNASVCVCSCFFCLLPMSFPAWSSMLIRILEKMSIFSIWIFRLTAAFHIVRIFSVCVCVHWSMNDTNASLLSSIVICATEMKYGWICKKNRRQSDSELYGECWCWRQIEKTREQKKKQNSKVWKM